MMFLGLSSFAYAEYDYIEEDIGFKYQSIPALDEIHVAYEIFDLDEFEDKSHTTNRGLTGNVNPDAVDLKKRFDARIFEATGMFVVNQPYTKFNIKYFANLDRIKQVTPLLTNSKRIGAKTVLKTISPTHYLKRGRKISRRRLYVQSQLDLPNSGEIASLIQYYLKNRASKDAVNRDENGNYIIRTISEFSFSDTNYMNANQEKNILNSGIPNSIAKPRAILKQHIFFADHIIRYGKANIIVQELSPTQSLVTLKLAIAINGKLMDIPSASLWAMKGIPLTDKKACPACKGLETLTEEALANLKNEFSH